MNGNKGQPRICIIALTMMAIQPSRLVLPHEIGANWSKRRATQEEVSIGLTVFLGEKDIYKVSDRWKESRGERR